MSTTVLGGPGLVSVVGQMQCEEIPGTVGSGRRDQREALGERTGEEGWARQAARPTQVRSAIPGRSHRASSVGRHEEGQRTGGYSCPPGLSSSTAPWRPSDEGFCQGRHAGGSCAPRGVACAHRGSGCHGLPRRIHPTWLGSAWPAGVSSAMTAGWTKGNRGSLDRWAERRTIASLARRGGGPRIGRIDAVHNGRRWRSRAGGTTWAGGVFCTIAYGFSS